MTVARDEGLHRIWADMLSSNSGMRHVSRTVGFALRPGEDPSTVRAELRL